MRRPAAEHLPRGHEVNASFLTFMPHSDPMDAEQNPWVHYICLFMTLLLLGVFGFFGLHALLWLQRTLVGRLRGEFKVQHGGPGPYVRRFTTTQMWLHVSIILSFLLLSVTGLPLKFAAAPWAPGLMKALGGPEVASWLHRFAAIVTFGYFAVHLPMLFRDIVLKRQKGYFWGWRSMTPNLKDLQDLSRTSSTSCTSARAPSSTAGRTGRSSTTSRCSGASG